MPDHHQAELDMGNPADRLLRGYLTVSWGFPSGDHQVLGAKSGLRGGSALHARLGLVIEVSLSIEACSPAVK